MTIFRNDKKPDFPHKQWNINITPLGGHLYPVVNIN